MTRAATFTSPLASRVHDGESGVWDLSDAARVDWWTTFNRCAVALRGSTAILTLAERRAASALRLSGTSPYAAAAEIMEGSDG